MQYGVEDEDDHKDDDSSHGYDDDAEDVEDARGAAVPFPPIFSAAHLGALPL
jgi:hypothetical protein